VVAPSLQLQLYGPEFSAKPLRLSAPLDPKVSFSTAPTNVGEAEKVEGLGPSQSFLRPIRLGPSAKVEETGFVLVKFQTKRCEPFAQLSQELLGVVPILEADDKVVSIPDDTHVAPRLSRTPLMRPEVEHVVEKQVGQQGRDTRSLWRPFIRARSLSIDQHASLQPFLNEADDPPRSTLVFSLRSV